MATGQIPRARFDLRTISGGASFLRAQGGSGTAADPYQLIDIYGLQGVGSSPAYLAATWRLVLTARYGFDAIVFTADVKVV